MAKKAPQPKRGNPLQARPGFRPLTEPDEITPDPEGNRAQRRAAAKAAKAAKKGVPSPAVEEERTSAEEQETAASE
ncbi:hypothetical protein SAMN06297387_10996 [Streptomyces zhaozhouensis]|uniref:Uncharacterized protein n=1 Tax=Streptomyces zhaozhouensis TaxID=1300267 RepID=A0A286DX70_9ACTN|nr:hypothetical protein [Streptomyces zhaozhouensis]SOD63154.1 hypothetical protein SAMN06297387_10996 [Streptomyces zhaozhouensis]